MKLIRTALWLSVVVLMLPTDGQQQEKLYKTAADAATHAATFCERNKAVCAKGGEYWSVFQQKLQFGTKMVVDLASERMFGRSNAAPAATAIAPASQTLTPADMAPAWRGQQQGRSGA